MRQRVKLRTVQRPTTRRLDVCTVAVKDHLYQEYRIADIRSVKFRKVYEINTLPRKDLLSHYIGGHRSQWK